MAPPQPEEPAQSNKQPAKAQQPTRSTLPDNADEALRAAEVFRQATVDLADAGAAGASPAEIDILDRARMAAAADFLDKTPSDAALDWPQMSQEDEDYLYAYCEEIRGKFSTGAHKTVQDLGQDLHHTVYGVGELRTRTAGGFVFTAVRSSRLYRTGDDCHMLPQPLQPRRTDRCFPACCGAEQQCDSGESHQQLHQYETVAKGGTAHFSPCSTRSPTKTM